MPKGISINVGVNQPGDKCCETTTLLGPENDARVMAEIADGCRYAVAPPLLGADATRRSLEAEMVCASRRLEGGDILLLSFSGHGCQVDEGTCTEPPSCKAEAWCLADERLVDDDLQSLLGLFAERVRILVVSDSCFSQGMQGLREPNAGGPGAALSARRLRRRRPPARRRARPQLRDLRKPGIKVHASVLFLASCEEGRRSLDAEPGKRENGLFTHLLRRVWRRGDFSGSYISLMNEIEGLARVEPADQVPSTGWSGAKPLWITDPPFKI